MIFPIIKICSRDIGMMGPITFGGDGYQTGGPETKFMYPRPLNSDILDFNLISCFLRVIDFMLGYRI